jgi:site-specific DNA-methyltransferase (adenine-specific)
MKITDKIEITNEDNMLLMARYPDNYFDLAIVDPPYGINITKQSGFGTFKKDKKKNWDNEIPTNQYFNELFRISKNQIIWGANYFLDYLGNTNCCIIWDKMNGTNDMSDFELAWTSFKSPNRRFNMHHFSNGYGDKIHPTQKPVALYKWLLDKYAKDGDKILDTHLGSGSIAIACHEYGFELTACELDAEYFEKAVERIKNHVSQQKLF